MWCLGALVGASGKGLEYGGVWGLVMEGGFDGLLIRKGGFESAG